MKHTNPAVFPILSLFVSVPFSCSVVSDCLWPHGMQHTRSITNSRSLLKLMSIKSVMPSNHLILCCPLLLLPSVFPSIRESKESVLPIRWPKYWTSFSASVLPVNIQGWFPLGLTGLISLLLLFIYVLSHIHNVRVSLYPFQVYRFVWKTYSGNENHYLMEMLAYNTSLQY